MRESHFYSMKLLNLEFPPILLVTNPLREAEFRATPAMSVTGTNNRESTLAKRAASRRTWSL